MAKQFLKNDFHRIFFLTVCVMVLNYNAYYADDLVYAYQTVPHDTWFTFVCQFLAFPVTFYVEVFEKRYFLEVFLVGRTLNYLIELTYFFVLTAAVSLPAFWLVRKLRRYS